MAPVLDELVGKLGKKDQEAVLLRFYQRKRRRRWERRWGYRGRPPRSGWSVR